MGFWAPWCSSLSLSTPQASFFTFHIKGGAFSPDFPQRAEGSSCYPRQSSLFTSFLSLLSSDRNIKYLSSVSLLIQTWRHLRENDNKMKPLSQKTNKQNIKPIKGHIFGRTTFGRGKKKALFCRKKKSVRTASLGQLFVISAVGHQQAFADTPNLSSEHSPVLRQS